MYQNSECQLYKYNPSFYLIKKETAAYFAKEFLSSELDEDHVAWLNFHSLSDKVSIEMLCQHLSIDKISIENIFLELRRPKVEENTGYIFFKVICLNEAFLDKIVAVAPLVKPSTGSLLL